MSFWTQGLSHSSVAEEAPPRSLSGEIGIPLVLELNSKVTFPEGLYSLNPHTRGSSNHPPPHSEFHLLQNTFFSFCKK
jgi:hypothetical protein